VARSVNQRTGSPTRPGRVLAITIMSLGIGSPAVPGPYPLSQPLNEGLVHPPPDPAGARPNGRPP
jgi:hypothetical protein